MKDIDFDELDRAVSSLLTPKQEGGKKEAAPDAPTESTDQNKQTDEAAIPVKINSTSAQDENKNDQAKEIAEQEKAKVEPANRPQVKVATKETVQTKEVPAKPALAPRRNGRFMDVVHPDALQKDKPMAPPSHSNRVLQPTSSDFVKDTLAPASIPASSDASLATPSNSTEPVWPDPVAINEKAADSLDEPLQPMKDWHMVDGIADDFNKSAASPFLNDAKVEKRPLGAFSDTSPSSEEDEMPATSKGFHATRFEMDIERYDALEEEEEPEETEAAQEEPAPAPDTFDANKEPQQGTPVPRELEKDIVAVEADVVTVHAKEIQVNTDSPKPEVSAAPMTAGAAISAASATSIQKQYKESANSHDTNQHSLFDTEEYHPPITHHKDHRQHTHTILWVIVALLLLTATAAGFGYWLYLQI